MTIIFRSRIDVLSIIGAAHFRTGVLVNDVEIKTYCLDSLALTDVVRDRFCTVPAIDSLHLQHSGGLNTLQEVELPLSFDLSSRVLVVAEESLVQFTSLLLQLFTVLRPGISKLTILSKQLLLLPSLLTGIFDRC